MKLLLFILSFIFISTLTSQQRIKDFVAYSKECGLSQNTYHNVCETSDGYWWISSDNGVFRFDGKRFQQFNAFFDNPNSLSDNNIDDFAEDKNGNLWMAGFEHGLTKYNLKTGQFKKYPVLSTDNNPAAYGILKIFADSEGDIWAGTKGRGLAKYDPIKDTFQFYYPDNTKTKDGSRYGENVVSGIVQDNENKDLLWLSCFDGLYLFDKTSSSFLNSFKYNDPNTPGTLLSFLSVTQAGDNIYLGSWFEGLFCFNKKNKQLVAIPYNNPGKKPHDYCVLDVKAVSDSVVYLACINEGLLSYSISKKIIYPAIHPNDALQINNRINIQRISLTQHSGFFAGGNAAVYQLFPQPHFLNRFYDYAYINIFKGETDVGISSFSHDIKRNGYWVAFTNCHGIYFYDSVFANRIFFPLRASNITWFNNISLDGTNRVWATGTDDKLYSIDENKKQTILLSTPSIIEKMYENQYIESLTTDHSGNIWLAGNRRCYHYITSTQQVDVYDIAAFLKKNNAENILSNVEIQTDKNDDAWIGTNNGVIKLANHGNKIYYYKGQVNNQCNLAQTPVKAITIDKNNKLWIGYFNAGIQVLEINSMAITQSFTTENGLPGMEVNYLAADTSGNVAACFTNGLGVYSAKAQNWQFFNLNDGLRLDYLDVPVWATKNGNFILDQKGSFLVFDFEQLAAKQNDVPTHISSLKINNKPVQNGVLPDYIPLIELGPDTKEIEIAFSTLNWQFPLRTKYFYRVDGVHKKDEWLSTNNAIVNLTGIASGHYVFRFYALLADGTKTAERRLDIHIDQPFYKTWWFISCCIIAAWFVSYSLYRYRITQLKKMQHMRNSISRNLHDDIGSTLTNINILNELIKRNIPDNEKANEYLERSREDIQQASESLNDIVWNINPVFDNVADLIVRMKRYAGDMLDGKNITYKIDFPKDATGIAVNMEQRRDLYMIFKEAVNNLVKYSSATNAYIKLEGDNQQIKLQVTDDGKGFDMYLNSVGNGLYNMKQRTEKWGGIFQLTSKPGGGTNISIAIPFVK